MMSDTLRRASYHIIFITNYKRSLTFLNVQSDYTVKLFKSNYNCCISYLPIRYYKFYSIIEPNLMLNLLELPFLYFIN